MPIAMHAHTSDNAGNADNQSNGNMAVIRHALSAGILIHTSLFSGSVQQEKESVRQEMRELLRRLKRLNRFAVAKDQKYEAAPGLRIDLIKKAPEGAFSFGDPVLPVGKTQLP
jgi:hypothetical protein